MLLYHGDDRAVPQPVIRVHKNIKISAGDSIARKFNHRQQDGQHVVVARVL